LPKVTERGSFRFTLDCEGNRVRTILALFTAAALAGAAWLVTTRFEIRGLETVRLAPRSDSPADKSQAESALVAGRGGERLRIASFDLPAFDETHPTRPDVLERLARVVREFDVVALQGIASSSDAPLARLAAAASVQGRNYEHLLGPAVNPSAARERFAFLFDAQTVEVDHTECYLVNDPHDRLRSDPFVAWFRARGAPVEAAFTFTLVCVRVDPERTVEELDALADVFVRVRSDGRREDDVILLGNLNADDRYLGRLGDLPRITCAISAAPTTTRGDRQLANVIFDHRATNEFTGRVGVFDFLRELNLSLRDALEISEHLPVWAEFSVYEGGRPRTANQFGNGSPKSALGR
jgi:deoxyribonuclease-1-like protein